MESEGSVYLSNGLDAYLARRRKSHLFFFFNILVICHINRQRCHTQCYNTSFWFDFNMQAIKSQKVSLSEFQICPSPVTYLSDQKPPLAPMCRLSPRSQMTTPPSSTADRKLHLWTCKLWLLPQSGMNVDLNLSNAGFIIFHQM